jgi:hypothetical protein
MIRVETGQRRMIYYCLMRMIFDGLGIEGVLVLGRRRIVLLLVGEIGREMGDVGRRGMTDDVGWRGYGLGASAGIVV